VIMLSATGEVGVGGVGYSANRFVLVGHTANTRWAGVPWRRKILRERLAKWEA
jgi:hypothetical protein